MPGTIVTTATRSGPTADNQAAASTFFVVGLTERGPVDRAVLVHSVSEFESVFGGRVSYGFVWDAVKAFFEEGGDKAYVVRLVGLAQTAGTLTLQDRAGAPADTIKLDANGPGTWSTGVTVAVVDGSVEDTFKIQIRYGNDLENYDNLATPAEAVAAINARSRYVTATNLGSVTVAPGNQPAVLAATPLSAGNDDRASVVAADYLAALNERATYGLGAGAVAIPGQDGDTIGAGLIEHARLNNRLALLTMAAEASVADAIASAQMLKVVPGSEGAGLFYPWVLVPDGSGAAGATRAIPPEGFVAGVRARAHIAQGPWRAAAGEMGKARYILGVESDLTRAVSDQLDTAEVNAIKFIAGSVRLYGWRSLSLDEENYALLTGRDVLNYLVVEAEKRLEQFVFATIDSRGHLLANIENELIGLAEPLRVSGGLYERRNEVGEVVDPGYAVDTGPSVNPVSQLAQNIVAAELGVRVSPTGAIVKLLITKAHLTASL